MTKQRMTLGRALMAVGLAGIVSATAVVSARQAAVPEKKDDPRCTRIKDLLDRWSSTGAPGDPLNDERLPVIRQKKAEAAREVTRVEDLVRRAQAANSPPNILADAQGKLAAARAQFIQWDTKETYITGQINLLRDRASEFGCSWAGPRLGDLPSGGSGSSGSAGGSVGSTTPSTASVDPSGTTTKPAEIKPETKDWLGQWKHDFGTVTFRERTLDADFVLERLKADNPYGPSVTCDGVAAFSGELIWEQSGGGYDQGWNGEVFACTNGPELEGKIGNFGGRSVGVPLVGGAFKVKMTNPNKSEFGGNLRAFNPTTKAAASPAGWSGKK